MVQKLDEPITETLPTRNESKNLRLTVWFSPITSWLYKFSVLPVKNIAWNVHKVFDNLNPRLVDHPTVVISFP